MVSYVGRALGALVLVAALATPAYGQKREERKSLYLFPRADGTRVYDTQTGRSYTIRNPLYSPVPRVIVTRDKRNPLTTYRTRQREGRSTVTRHNPIQDTERAVDRFVIKHRNRPIKIPLPKKK